MSDEPTTAPEEALAPDEWSLPVLTRMDTLWGDVRDGILDRLRQMPKPWPTMSETEQRDMIIGVETVARHIVDQACQIIAANGQESFKVSPDSFKRGKDGGLTLSIKTDPSDSRVGHAMLDHQGPALLVLASSHPYMGAATEAKPDPDEPALPLGYTENVKPFKGRDKPGPTYTEVRRGPGRPRKDGSPSQPRSPSVTPAPITYVPPKDDRATSIEEILTVRHPDGANMAMIISHGFHASEVSELIADGQVEKREDGYFVWIKPAEADESGWREISTETITTPGITPDA